MLSDEAKEGIKRAEEQSIEEDDLRQAVTWMINDVLMDVSNNSGGSMEAGPRPDREGNVHLRYKDTNFLVKVVRTRL